jgi:hypothetical protein
MGAVECWLMHLERLALYYLVIPAAILLASFTAPLLMIPALLSLAIYVVVPRLPLEPSVPSTFWPLVAIACLWTWFSGVLPPFAQTWDWLKHYGIINLLVDQHWPPIINGSVFRYSAAWYVLPALIGKLCHGFTSWAIFIWTALGLSLGLALGLKRVEGNWWRVLAGLACLLFSGADWLGTLVTGEMPRPMHLEWWAGFASIPSITTSLIWTPQHLLPGLIATALFMRAPIFAARNTALIAFSTALWSPFVAFGLLPLALIGLRGVGLRPFLTLQNVVVTLGFGVPTTLFLLSSSGSIPLDFAWNVQAFRLWVLPVFWLFEFGIVIAVLVWGGQISSAEGRISGSFLLAITLVHYGFYSDLTMRASIPSVCFLALRLAEAITQQRMFVLVILLAIGLPTPAVELMRARLHKRIKNPDALSLEVFLSTTPELRSQYLAKPSWIFR